MAGPKTPVMQQHAEAKSAYPDAIVFFRLGDFYEMFGDDAVTAARVLDLTLTSRNRGKPDEVPMAGVPYHAAHGYLARLLTQGYKVAICEQMADPAKVKGIVPRQVVRVLTPGTVTAEAHLSAKANNWLAAIEASSARVGLALLDLSTGELRAAELESTAVLLSELARAQPSEVLLGGEAQLVAELETSCRALSPGVVRQDEPLSLAQVPDIGAELLSSFAALTESAKLATARALRFVLGCQPGRLSAPVVRLVHYDPSGCLSLDRTAVAHLELVQPLASTGSATLLGVIDETLTPMGGRLLRSQLLAPLLDVEAIRRRLDRVELFVQHQRVRSELRSALGRIGDLERLAVRAALAEASPRELGQLRNGLCAAREAAELLSTVPVLNGAEVLLLSPPFDTVTELEALLGRALVEQPPAQPKEGGVFRTGFDPELDELETLAKQGTELMLKLEARLRQELDVGSLKVRYTRVFGWYIEVGKSHVRKVPAEWRRKQTVAGGERYTNDELDQLAYDITTAEERRRERELVLLEQLVAEAGRAAYRIHAIAVVVAQWDVAAALAEVAHRYDYVRPEVDDSDTLQIRDGRHPVVERLAAFGRFVPNDVELTLDSVRLWLLTGPNMAGKSTFLRQVALIVILAQMGSFVPASAARVGLVDSVLSRVGANDNLAQGQSTFMVEMTEAAAILRKATRRSLLILDEIGRGTSTFDGLAIAWAIAEHLEDTVACRALFATHYHELTVLAERSSHVANYSVSAQEMGEEIVFLHRVEKGAASRSYGVAVARLAGLPEPVLARARVLLAELEGGTQGHRLLVPERAASSAQLDLFASPEAEAAQQVVRTLKHTDPDNLTPIEAHRLLVKLTRKL